MQKLTIHNFGPIQDCEVIIKDFTVLIGPQSSGKSTISKLTFFFLNLRENAIDFILNELDTPNPKLNFNNFTKQIRKRFLEFWGPIPNAKDLFIKFEYGEDTSVEIKLDDQRHKFVTPRFSNNIINAMREAYQSFKDMGIGQNSIPSLFATPNMINQERTRTKIITSLKSEFGKLFQFDKELFFIPAGRSLLSTISDQLQYIHPHQLDYPMRQFIERINATKAFFNKSFDDIIRERHVLEKSVTHRGTLEKAGKIINRILKAEYRHDKDGGKIYIGDGKYTKINFASSGQQESVWILLSLFLILLEKVDAFIFIEEPEAHLFPIAQKQMVSLICYVANVQNCKFMITSHSPYILSAINNHVYASVVGKLREKEVDNIIPKKEWLNHKRIDGFLVDEGSTTALYDEDLKMLKTELVDSASDIVNTEYDELFTIENSDQKVC